MAGTDTITDVVAWLESLPDGTLIPPGCVAERLRGAAAPLNGASATEVPVSERPPPGSGWRERVWTCPPETRLTAVEVAEALGKSRDAVYRLTSEKHADKQIAEGHTDPRLPHRKDISGTLTFLAGEVRQWIEAHEEVIAKPPAPFPERLKVVGS